MSFLSRYWNAVERQHSETGMNHGDIRVVVEDVKENTPVVNVVDPQTTQPKTQSNRPTQDGSMPWDPEKSASKFERGSARPAERIQTMAEDERPTREANTPRDCGVQAKRSERESESGDQTKKTAREVKRLQRKALKKLGAGRKVNVCIEKVTINGQSWSTATQGN